MLVALMINEYSQEIQTYIKSQILKPDDEVTLADGSKAKFKELATTYYGRLMAPSVEPGHYVDRTRAVIELPDQTLKTIPLDTLTIDPILLAQRVTSLQPGYHFIFLAKDQLGELPETAFMESDVVSITDTSHEQYSTNPDQNQFTVYRIYYDTTSQPPTKYRLRAGKLQFDANEDQLKLMSQGPIRLFHGGEGFKLLWRTLKSEAEFYLLMGRYNRVYNPTNKSYNWDLQQAKALIAVGKAHSVLQLNDNYYLVNFWDQDIGYQVACEHDLILDI
jgi:hypothetical protein